MKNKNREWESTEDILEKVEKQSSNDELIEQMKKTEEE
jgi:hypothetical protein